jgi:TRAP-type C4-dicarboxylate transport system substrate-binding protein
MFRKGFRMKAITPPRPFAHLTARACVVATLAWPFATAAEPIHLNLSFYESEHTAAYQYGIKPFVDAVNGEGRGRLYIEVHAEGALGAGLAGQPRLVLDGVADIAFVIPGQTPYRFPDNELLELPGLFRSVQEGTLTYTHLIAKGALRGYDNFFVIGAYTTSPNAIHSRRPTRSLDGFKGQKIRANNPTEAAALERLGALPTVMPVSKVAAAIEKGSLDAAAAAPTALLDYHMMDVVTNHFLLASGVNPLLVLMNRKKFDSLPEPAKALIRKYSADWTAAKWIESYAANEQAILERIKSDPHHAVFEPSADDVSGAQRIFRSLLESWAAKNARATELLKTTEGYLATIRSTR